MAEELEAGEIKSQNTIKFNLSFQRGWIFVFCYLCSKQNFVMELTINIDQNKKEAKALIKYLQSLPFVDIKQKSVQEEVVPKKNAIDFVKKWKGFLKNENKATNDARFDYLMKKHG